MENDFSISLSFDILSDHFGVAVARVGRVLIERGALSLQDILRFTNMDQKAGDDELTFPIARNALLILVRHGVAHARPHEKAQGLFIYAAKVEVVLARTRFPQFVEHVYWTHGEIAAELVMTSLRYGRMSAQFAVSEAERYFGVDVQREEIEKEFRHLVTVGLLRAVQAVEQPAVASSPSAAGVEPRVGEKRKHEDMQQEQSQLVPTTPASASDAKVLAGASGSTAKLNANGAGVGGSKEGLQFGEIVYTYSRRTFTLCLCKNLVCRMVEKKLKSARGAAENYYAKVLVALLSSVKSADKTEVCSCGSTFRTEADQHCHKCGAARREDAPPVSEYMQFEAIFKRMQELGVHAAGPDPRNERKSIIRVLDLLTNTSDSLLRRRTVKAKFRPGMVNNVVGGDDEPVTSLRRTTSSRAGASASSSSRAKAAVPAAEGALEDIAEWAVDWKSAKKLVRNGLVSQLIREQFGVVGLRIYNLLVARNPHQKLEDREIFSVCMVQMEEGRDVLNTMVRQGIINWQEVPKSGRAPLQASFWLYYVDEKRMEFSLARNALQSILNLRIRFRLESSKVSTLLRGALTDRERTVMAAGKRREDVLERNFLVLDTVVLVLTCF